MGVRMLFNIGIVSHFNIGIMKLLIRAGEFVVLEYINNGGEDVI
jgi:hypothetical protein